MASVVVRLYAELGDLVSAHLRYRDVVVDSPAGRSVKDLIEGLGVPHTEVDLVLVDGVSVGLDHALSGGERLAVYPVFEALDITEVTMVRAEPLRHPRFLLDVHLGRLAAYLRIAGFDTLYENDAEDEDIAESAGREGRIVLTRDRGLLKRSIVTHGYLVRSADPREQLSEVVDRFDLGGLVAPFTRCSVCNGVLERVEREAVIPLLPERTAATQRDFRRCPGCGRVYWPGSHHRALNELMQEITRGRCGGRHGLETE